MYKKNRRVRLNYFIVIMITLIASSFLLLLKEKKCSNLDCISFFNKETYKMEEVFVDKDDSFLAEYSNQDSILRIEIINQNREEAENLIKSRIARIQNQYEENISPYPGEISDSISCPSSFRPKINTYEQSGINISSFLVKLNERMVAGQCENSLIKYHSYNYYFYCQNQNKTFLVEIIYDKNFEKVEQLSFTCN